jgi:hypothetical protein
MGYTVVEPVIVISGGVTAATAAGTSSEQINTGARAIDIIAFLLAFANSFLN